MGQKQSAMFHYIYFTQNIAIEHASLPVLENETRIKWIRQHKLLVPVPRPSS